MNFSLLFKGAVTALAFLEALDLIFGIARRSSFTAPAVVRLMMAVVIVLILFFGNWVLAYYPITFENQTVSSLDGYHKASLVMLLVILIISLAADHFQIVKLHFEGREIPSILHSAENPSSENEIRNARRNILFADVYHRFLEDHRKEVHRWILIGQEEVVVDFTDYNDKRHLFMARRHADPELGLIKHEPILHSDAANYDYELFRVCHTCWPALLIWRDDFSDTSRDFQFIVWNSEKNQYVDLFRDIKVNGSDLNFAFADLDGDGYREFVVTDDSGNLKTLQLFAINKRELSYHRKWKISATYRKSLKTLKLRKNEMQWTNTMPVARYLE